MNSKYISDYVYLAEASYADFSGTNFNIVNEVNNAIINTDLENPKAESFAKLVTNNYTVEAHYQDRADTHPVNSVLSDESGFSSTLFQHKETGEYVLAMRGTAGSKDLETADLWHIVGSGLAHHQIVDMYPFSR